MGFSTREGYGTTVRARVWTVVAIWFCFGGSAAVSQDKNWTVLVGTSSTVPPVSKENLALRPNARQPYYLFVRKAADAQQSEVVVRLLQQLEGKGPLVLAEKKVTVPDDKPVWVRFGEPKPAPKKPEFGKPPLPLPEPEFAPLAGAPPYQLVVEVRDANAPAKEAPLSRQTLEVSNAVPAHYVDIKGVEYKIGATPEDNTFRIDIQAKEGFHGSPCPVELVLSPELIDGLRRTKSGYLKRDLNKAEQKIQLVAENVTFTTQDAPKQGIVALTVDGYPRAFLCTVDFSRPNTDTQPKLVRNDTPTVLLLDDRTASIPVPKVTLRLQVDHATSNDVYLELGVDRNRDGKYDPDLGEVQKLPGDRERLVSLAPAGLDGEILFKTEVRYWQLDVDTAGIYGKLPYRVRVLEKVADKIIELPVRDAQGNLFKGGVTGTLNFDDTPPEDVRFPDDKDFPREHLRSQPLQIAATGKDPESGIARVAFFLGKPEVSKDGKEEVPPKTELFPAEEKDGWWIAQLPGPEKTGLMYVTALFVNGAGQSKLRTVEIRLVDPGTGGAGAAAAGKKFKVSGKVEIGDAAQPGLDVILRDDKGAVKGTTKTSSDPKKVGTYTFENVAPGAYTVSSANVGANTKGEALIAVEAADVKDVNIKLYR